MPTVAEEGLPGFEATSWFALFVPAGTPRDVVARLNAEVRRVFQLPDAQERLKTLGLDAVLLSTEPYRFTQAHADALEKQLGIPVFLVDGEMMSWYGSRALAGLRYLRALRETVEGRAAG